MSNWAYNVMASLAYSISRWLRLLLPESGRWAAQHRQEKQAVLKLSFCSFVARVMSIPAQIVKGARRVTWEYTGASRHEVSCFRRVDCKLVPGSGSDVGLTR